MRFAAGKYAEGICDRCGLTFKLHDLKPLTINRVESGVIVCDDCWEPDNPRLFAPRVVADAEALYRPRPDNKSAPGLVNITWAWRPVWSFKVQSAVGAVTVVTP